LPPLTPESQLIRNRNVTASEVGALLGKHPYTSPAQIFDRLRDPELWQSLRDPQNEAMALGVYFEPYIARYAARKLGLRLRANTRTIEHPTHPLCATPDYLVLGQRILVEVKLSSIMYGWDAESLAPHIEWQARAQMACTNRDAVIIAALVGSRFYDIPVVRDAAKEREMLDAVAAIYLLARSDGERPEEKVSTKLTKVTVEGSNRNG
jgi:predicted phage-related endonuclease